MQSLMFYQAALLTECLITYFTAIRALTTMYAYMPYQIAPFTECLITHITHKRALSTMYALMCYHIALCTECLSTNITTIWTPTPLYITGISAFITLYMKLFIQSTLVKKQRLNIRIYFDRKKYIYSYVYIHYKSNTYEELVFKKCIS